MPHKVPHKGGATQIEGQPKVTRLRSDDDVGGAAYLRQQRKCYFQKFLSLMARNLNLKVFSSYFTGSQGFGLAEAGWSAISTWKQDYLKRVLM